ncbi:MAG: RidA family protein [Eisenbergiella sp.]
MALAKMESVLKAAGWRKEDVVMCRIYVSSMDYWGDVNKVYSEFFGEHKPAGIVLPVGRLNKGCLLELEATASA